MVVERAIDPDTWRTAGFAEEPPNHFLDIDWAGTAVPVRGAAARLRRGGAKFGKDRVIQERHGAVARRRDYGQPAARVRGATAAAAVRADRRLLSRRVAGALHVGCARAVSCGGQLRRPADRPEWVHPPVGNARCSSATGPAVTIAPKPIRADRQSRAISSSIACSTARNSSPRAPEGRSRRDRRPRRLRRRVLRRALHGATARVMEDGSNKSIAGSGGA